MLFLEHLSSHLIIASHIQDIDKNISIDAPVISIDRIISLHIPSICSGNHLGGVLATEHLIDKEATLFFRLTSLYRYANERNLSKFLLPLFYGFLHLIHPYEG